MCVCVRVYVCMCVCVYVCTCARCYLDYLFQQNEYTYPVVGVENKKIHDSTNLYAWIPLTLGCKNQQKDERSGVMVLPPTNTPHNVKTSMTDMEFKQVLFGDGLCGQ